MTMSPSIVTAFLTTLHHCSMLLSAASVECHLRRYSTAEKKSGFRRNKGESGGDDVKYKLKEVKGVWTTGLVVEPTHGRFALVAVIAAAPPVDLDSPRRRVVVVGRHRGFVDGGRRRIDQLPIREEAEKKHPAAQIYIFLRAVSERTKVVAKFNIEVA